MKAEQFENELAKYATSHGNAIAVDSWGKAVVGFAMCEEEDLDMGEGPVVQLQTDADNPVSVAVLLERYRSSKSSAWDELWVQDGDESDLQEIAYAADEDRVYLSC